MVAVVLRHSKKQGKTYRIAKEEDLEVFMESENCLKEKRTKLMDEWGIDPVPGEEIPLMSGVFNVPIYGMHKWGDLFNSRQKLALITFMEKVRQVHEKMLEAGSEEEYAKAVVSYLALAFDRLTTRNSNICVWHNGSEQTEKIFAFQALPMQWGYPESNPLTDGNVTGFLGNIESILSVLENICKISDFSPVTVTQSSATSLLYPDNYFDAVFTDPPYYFNVPYADLSDFFYVWLKRTIGNIFPELFSTPLSPKKNEIVQMEHWDTKRYPEKDKEWFEKMLTKSFQEIYRLLKPNGIAIIVYAHKSTEGWETLINSLLDSGLVVTGAWPINTEMQTRSRAHESAALSSSIYIITRKIKRESAGFYNNIKEELKNYLYEKLERLWTEGISGADFFIAAIGSAIEIFGKYKKIIDYEGNSIRASQMLSDVRRITTDYAVHQILHNGFAGDISNLTRFYVLYRWSYGETKLHFDEARKLSTSANVALEKEWNRPSFIKKEKEFIRVLGPQDRKFEDFRNSSELVDVLHTVLLLWEKGRRNEMITLLEKSGYGKSDAFYRVAQTISETLPNESKEKKLLDGFLSGKMRLQEEIKIKTRETRINLFNYKDK